MLFDAARELESETGQGRAALLKEEQLHGAHPTASRQRQILDHSRGQQGQSASAPGVDDARPNLRQRRMRAAAGPWVGHGHGRAADGLALGTRTHVHL